MAPQLFNSDYVVSRNDCSSHRAGGALIVVRANISYREIIISEPLHLFMFTFLISWNYSIFLITILDFVFNYSICNENECLLDLIFCSNNTRFNKHNCESPLVPEDCHNRGF